MIPAMRLLLSCLGWLVLPACQVVFPLGRDNPDLPDGAPTDGVPTDAPPDAIAPIDVGLVLHLTFDDPNTINADELGHPVDCLGPCGQQTDDPHQNNEAIALAGSCLGVTSAQDLEPTTLSIALWARQSTPPLKDAQTLIARLNGVGPAAFTVSSEMLNWSFSVADTTAGDETSSDGQWHHVAIVFSDPALTVFVDGQLASGPLQTTVPTYPASEPITIGCRMTASGPGEHFIGDFDDVRIYNRALTAAEIQVLSTP